MTTGKKSESGLAIKRSLCDTQAGWCLDGIFKKNLMYLMEHYAPLDSQITFSSVFGSGLRFTKETIRFTYNGTDCAWIKAVTDSSPWVKFDFLQSLVAVGVKMGKRCDHTIQYVTSLHVSISADDVTWSYIGTEVQAVYEGNLFTWWFDRDVSSRYWRIEPVTYMGHPAMQVNFIGYIEGT